MSIDDYSRDSLKNQTAARRREKYRQYHTDTFYQKVCADPSSMKRCPVCNSIKHVSSFPRHKSRAGGFGHKCNACVAKKAHVSKTHVPEGLRRCIRCGDTKELRWFPTNKTYTSGRANECALCSTLRIAGTRNGFSIDAKEYHQLLEQQSGVCKICGNPPPKEGRMTRLSVDHCHTTGEIRGLLCLTCNTGLGMFRDSTGLLNAAIHYLNP